MKNVFQNFNSNETDYRTTYDETTHLSICEDDEKYFIISQLVSYNRYNIPDTLSFKCSIDEPDREEAIILDREHELSWFFVNAKDNLVIPEDAFVFEYVKVGGTKLKNIDIQKCDKHIQYTFIVPEKERKGRNQIDYSLKVKQARDCGFYTSVIPSPTRGINIDFTIADHIKVNGLYAFSHFTSEQRPVYGRMSDQHRKVKAEGWIFPNSGAVFSWAGFQIEANPND